MTARRGRTGAALLALVASGLLVAGCAAGPTGGTTGSPPPSGSPTGASGSPTGGESAAAVLVIEYTGGLVPPTLQHTVPAVSLWRDGLAVTPGAQIAVSPPPALPSVSGAQVDPAAMPGVIDTLEDGLSGLPDDFGMPPTADVPTTVVTWRGDGVSRTWTAASLGVGDDVASEGVSADQVRNRQQLTRVVDYAQAVVTGALPNVPVTGQGPYATSAWYVWSTPYRAQAQPPEQEARRWPGPPLVAGASDVEWDCQVVGGEQAASVEAALASATTATPWRSGGRRWLVQVRPVLPGEPTDSCVA